jgi:RNA ligase
MALHYDFPRILNIDDVLPFIDDDCFKVKVADCGHTYINYVKMGPDTFPTFNTPADRSEVDAWNHRAAVRRECRGIAFDTRTGLLCSRPFHKFFNVGENKDMDIENLNFGDEHWVCDKVDGSMLRPIWTKDGLRWGTKMGLTDTAAGAEKWLADHPYYAEMATHYFVRGYTPIFEFVSAGNRVVVDYGDTDMILLAIRENVTGGYLIPDAVENAAERYGIPSARLYDPVEGDAANYIEGVKKSDDLDEGIVIQWWNGHRAKCKTDTYSALHRVKESARTERTLVTAILEEEVDDLLPLLPVEDRDRITKYIDRFWHRCGILEDDFAALYADVRENWETKKDFAISTFTKDLTQIEKSTMFAMWDGKRADAREAAMHIVTQGLTSETKWAEMKQNIAMSGNLNNFDTGWKEQEDLE